MSKIDLRRYPRINRNDLNASTEHLKGFQSRDPRKLTELDIDLPTRWYPIGVMESTWYFSDKDDPLTRPEHLRANDPDGRQGVEKHFEHKHDLGVILYCGEQILPKLDNASIKNFVVPDLVWYLAKLDKLRFNAWDDSHKKVKPDHRGAKIWATPDTRALLVLPNRMRSSPKPEECFMVCGGKMRVTPMGIEW